jgi:hypothetical protein
VASQVGKISDLGPFFGIGEMNSATVQALAFKAHGLHIPGRRLHY